MGARDKIVKTIVDLAKPARSEPLTGFAPGSAARLDQIFQPIKTWHASPYDFDAVDLKKAGTGQGASMYGHGFYSAQSPEVSGVGGAYWKEFARHPKFDRDVAGDAHTTAFTLLQQHKFDRASAAAYARKFADDVEGVQPGHPQADKMRRAADMLESGAQVGPRVYETHLYAKPGDYLDWDKPLGRQSELVQTALEDIPGWSTPYRTDWRGEDIYKSIADFAGGGKRGQKAATEMLADVGVPGVRYLDQHSRRAFGAQLSMEDISREIDALQSDLMNLMHGASKAKEIQAQIDNLSWQRGVLEKQVNEATYNYVTGNTDIIDLAKKLAVPAAAVPIGAIAAQDQYEATP